MSPFVLIILCLQLELLASLRLVVSNLHSSYDIECDLECNVNNCTQFDYGLILINSKHLYEYKENVNHIIIQDLAPNNRYSVAIYFIQNQQIRMIGNEKIDIDKNNKYYHKNPITTNTNSKLLINFRNDKIQTLSTPIMSTYYSTISNYNAQAMQNTSYDMKMMGYKNTIPPNIETSIRSASNISIYDLNKQWAWTVQESKINSSIKSVEQSSSFYQERPSQFGYYCLYYKRANETYGAIPDCPNVTNILTEHAKMLQSSGIDFMALDDTNLDNAPYDVSDDVMQLRPAEIIYETWNNLRNKSGTNTPDVVTWNKANGVEWKSYLNLYEQYPNMVFQVNDPNDGNKLKKVFFVPANKDLNQTVVNMIANNNGKNDILVQGMWGGGGMNESLILNGTWTFFYPCRVKNKQGNWQQSISMESLTECNFMMSVNSALGSQISASMSWQHNYGSLPFCSPSKLNGRTFMLIIADVLLMKPDNVLYPSFNTHTARGKPTSVAFGGNNTWGVGLYGDTQRSQHGFFVDNYGSERSRSIEPTDESGDYYYRLMQSCIRVIRLEYYFNDIYDNKMDIISDNVKDTNVICKIQGEICCNELQSYVDVWSLFNSKTNDFMVSNSPTEVQQVIVEEGYVEICAPTPCSNTSVFCTSSQDLNTFDAHRGPFILYKNENNPSDGSFADTKIGRNAIYRCIVNGLHFVSDSSNCEGINASKMEYLIGYAAISPSTAMPRRLVRCQDSVHKNYYHVVDDACIKGDVSSSVLGYVFG
eukprot:171472_1